MLEGQVAESCSKLQQRGSGFKGHVRTMESSLSWRGRNLRIQTSCHNIQIKHCLRHPVIQNWGSHTADCSVREPLTQWLSWSQWSRIRAACARPAHSKALQRWRSQRTQPMQQASIWKRWLTIYLGGLYISQGCLNIKCVNPQRQKSTVHPIITFKRAVDPLKIILHRYREKLFRHVIVSAVVRRGLVCGGTTAVCDCGSGNGSKG